jgi:thioesterase domain-containing protein
VTAEQKVTRQETADYDVCGWSAGILVSFAVRKGLAARLG